MADSLINDKGNLPKDLQIIQQPQTDKNYYNFKATSLKINTPYYIKFQWVYEDGTVSNWSSGYFIQTSNETAPAVPTGVTVPSTAVGSIPVELSAYPQNAKRVDVYISGGIFGTSKIAYSFNAAGKTTIAAPAGEYIVQLRSVSPSGITSTVGTTFTITISDAGETIQSPTNPSGFSAKRILGGIEVSWAGTYANGTFTGFEAVNVYVGNSASATPGTYEQAGVLTGNNVKNTIVIPLGTYVQYGQPVYIHAAAVNKSGTIGTIQANVASVANGAGKATDVDINDGAVVISKLASNVLYVDNLKAGTLNSSSYIRSGSKTGARIEISSATSNITTETDPITGVTSSLTYPVKPGITIYGTNGTTELLRADYSGNLSITGSGTFTGNLAIGTSPNIFKAEPDTGIWLGGDGTYSGSNFRVSTSGILRAKAGNIGDWEINEQALKSSAVAFPNIELDPVSPKIEMRQTASNSSDDSNYIKMDTTSGLRIGSGLTPNFKVDMAGAMTATGATVNGKLISSGSNPQGFTGTLTIDAGWITQTSHLYFDTPSFYVDSGDFAVTTNTGSTFGYLNLSGTGTVVAGTGNTSTGLQFRVQQADVFAGEYTLFRGYTFWGLGDRSEFKDPFLTTNDGSVSNTVGIDLQNNLVRGRALYQGAKTSASALDSAFIGETGDLYFSTA